MPEACSRQPEIKLNPRYTEAPLRTSSKTLRVAGTWSGPVRTELTVRDFSFVSDQPVVRGGSDQGPAPMEYLIGGVSSCIAVAVEQLAHRRALPLTDISTYTLARQDTRGLAGQADVQPYFYVYRLQLVVETSEQDSSVLTDFAQWAEHICPAINLLRDAHIDLEVAWAFVHKNSPGLAEALANHAWGYEVDGDPNVGSLIFEIINADATSDVTGVNA
ncbi:OsmC family protein [Nesterenkonia sp. AY15]|uniref:OsmC family protein n=1 Tax=Nesterenkonia sp. AY15 TaxID=2901139 RepID=UPI00237ABCFC|nr:OsmC family protein [Nesterenkonia sp. AY15]